MSIIKYLLIKTYRNKINEEYSKELCDKLLFEEKQLEEIYLSSVKNSK